MSRHIMIDREQADKVIAARVPTGKFYVKDGDIYIGIDNGDGNAWVEEFKTKRACIRWLDGQPTKDAHGQRLNG